MSTEQPAKPGTDIQNVVAFPLRGPLRDKLLHPEGLEDSRGNHECLKDPEQRRQFRELLDDASRGGPIPRR